MIHLLAIASNNRGESCELPDCELDATNIAEAFEPFCASAKCLLAEKATRNSIFTAVRKFLATLGKGDLGLLYFSGHGTFDTIKGKRVEAIVCHGLELIYDFELRAELTKRAAGSMLASLADCCFSGGLPRGHGKARTVAVKHCFKHTAELPTRGVKRPNATYAACRAGEVAFSTGMGGAMTLTFLEAFAERQTNTTLPALHKRIQKMLPNDRWNQHPCFYTDNAMKRRTLQSFAEVA